MSKEEYAPKISQAAIEPLPKDASRLLMMRRVNAMTVDQRLDLFERLSRRVIWARSAKRVR